MKKTNSSGEPKDVTCAVRFNTVMYSRLKETAEDLGLSLSDIIRQALTQYMEEHSKSLLEKKLRDIELRKKIKDATEGEDSSLRNVLLELLEKTG